MLLGSGVGGGGAVGGNLNDIMSMSLDARQEIGGLSGLEHQLLSSTEANQLLDDLAFLSVHDMGFGGTGASPTAPGRAWPPASMVPTKISTNIGGTSPVFSPIHGTSPVGTSHGSTGRSPAAPPKQRFKTSPKIGAVLVSQ